MFLRSAFIIRNEPKSSENVKNNSTIHKWLNNGAFTKQSNTPASGRIANFSFGIAKFASRFDIPLYKSPYRNQSSITGLYTPLKNRWTIISNPKAKVIIYSQCEESSSKNEDILLFRLIWFIRKSSQYNSFYKNRRVKKHARICCIYNIIRINVQEFEQLLPS